MPAFTQLNLHKAEQASNLLWRGLKGKTNQVLLLTEPRTVNGQVTSLPKGTRLIYKRTTRASEHPPRAAVLITKDVQATALDNLCTRDCAAALVKIHDRQVLVASIYLDIKKTVTPGWLTSLLDTAASKRWPVLIGMDSNAHSSLFGPDNNARGDELEDLILANSLTVENTGDTPTFETRRGTTNIATHIDVTLTRDLHFSLENWRVCQEYNASDHNTIRFDVSHPDPHIQRIRPWSRADWPTFTQKLREADYAIPQAMSMKKLDKLVTKLYAVLNEAIDHACPEIEVRARIKGSHWATDKHDAEKKKVSKLYRDAKNKGTIQAWTQYREADRAFKKLCKRDKNRAWRQYKESLQTTKDMATLARLAQRSEQRNIDTLTKPDGTITEPGTETMTLLTDTHFPAATDKIRVRYNNRRNCTIEELTDKYNDWISLHLIKEALGGFGKKKSQVPTTSNP